MKQEDIFRLAESMGAKISCGINWYWANGFPDKDTAEKFIRLIDRETRGVYDDRDTPTFSVRFR